MNVMNTSAGRLARGIVLLTALSAMNACRDDRPLSPGDPDAARRGIPGDASIQSGTGHYASPNGLPSGDGTLALPWDLQTALDQPLALAAGDTLWLRGGVYNAPATGFQSSLDGTSSAPIYVRQYPGEIASLDGAATNGTSHVLQVNGQYAVYWGFEIIDSKNESRSVDRPHLIYNTTSHNRYVALVLRDGGTAFYKEASASDVAVIGCVVYNNGHDASPNRAHGLYVRNRNGNLPTQLLDNVVFNQFGYGIHASSDVDVANEDMYAVVVKRNISFNNGSISMQSGWAPNILLGVAKTFLIAAADTVRANLTYFSPGVGTTASNITLGRAGFTNGDIVVDSNYVVGGTYVDTPDYRAALTLWPWTSALVKGNRVWSNNNVVAVANSSGLNWSTNAYYRPASAPAWVYQTPRIFSDWQAQTGLGATDLFPAQPTADSVIARAAALDWLNGAPLKRGTIGVFNWLHTPHNAIVNLTNVVAVGDSFWIRNVQQLGDTVAEGVYQSGTVLVPVGEVAAPTPVGSDFRTPLPNTHTGNVVWFDAFVVDSRTPGGSLPDVATSVTLTGVNTYQGIKQTARGVGSQRLCEFQWSAVNMVSGATAVLEWPGGSLDVTGWDFPQAPIGVSGTRVFKVVVSKPGYNPKESNQLSITALSSGDPLCIL